MSARPRSPRTTAPPRTSLGRSSQRSPTAERRPRPPDLRRSGSYSVPFASATEASSDQSLREQAGVGGRGKGLDRSSGDRVYRTSLSVFASRDTGRVFRPPSGRPDNLQPPSSRRRGVRASTTSSSVNPALQLSCESDPLNRGRLVDAVARGQPVWWRRNSAPLLEADGVDREPARCRPPRQPAPRCPRSRVARHMARCHRSSPDRASRS
jgi:hypothetical protein